jgi:hypothetical protein
MTHLTYPTLSRGAPSSPPASAGGEDVSRRFILLGGASVALTGCFDRPCHEKNEQQREFLDRLSKLSKPALTSGNPLQIEEAANQSIRLAETVGAFTDWCGTLRKIEGTAQNVAVTIEIGPQASIFAFNDWTLAMAGSIRDLFSTRSREPRLTGLSDGAVAALKTFRLGDRVQIAGKMGNIAGSGLSLADLKGLFIKTEADNRQFLQTPRFIARIETVTAERKS